MFSGAINEGQKLWMYQNCAALWFPSGAEGFGLPVIEAFSLGKPVFAWKGTSLTEVGGELAYYWDNWSTEHLLAVWQRGMKEWGGDARFAEGAKKWATQFTWQKAAKSYKKLYQSLLLPINSSSN